MSESDQAVDAYMDEVRKFYEWVTKTISTCAYEAEELQKGESA